MEAEEDAWIWLRQELAYIVEDAPLEMGWLRSLVFVVVLILVNHDDRRS